jgi:hypothetical protein
MDFTPSKIDALEEIPPPTPPPKPSSLKHRGPTWSKIFGWLPGYNPNPPPTTSAEPTPKPQASSDGDHEGNRPGTTAKHIGEELPQGLVENNTSTAPRAEHEELSSPVGTGRRGKVRGDHKNNYEQQRRPTTRRLTRSATRQTHSTTRIEKTSPVVRRTRLGKNTSPALTQSSKISKPMAGPRRSVRIAEREQRLNGPNVLPKIVKATDGEDTGVVQTLKPLKKPKQQKIMPWTRATTRKKGHPRERQPSTSSKPQGVIKRTGHSRLRQLNA